MYCALLVVVKEVVVPGEPVVTDVVCGVAVVVTVNEEKQIV